jgi:EAL domain-containing protein (putative c-di-GMP-specific phosphodiesterase class I)
LPWTQFDVLFVGGTTEWKLGLEARGLVAEAKRRGKHVHMGRVNSEKRLRYAAAIGCDSADGTCLTRGPDVNLPKVLAWLRAVNEQPPLIPSTPPHSGGVPVSGEDA